MEGCDPIIQVFSTSQFPAQAVYSSAWDGPVEGTGYLMLVGFLNLHSWVFVIAASLQVEKERWRKDMEHQLCRSWRCHDQVCALRQEKGK